MIVKVRYTYEKSWYRGDMMYGHGTATLNVDLTNISSRASVATLARRARKEANKILQARINHDKEIPFCEGALESVKIQKVVITI